MLRNLCYVIDIVLLMLRNVLGHNSIVYHCRRHIGDYPYKCQDCGFVEVILY